MNYYVTKYVSKYVSKGLIVILCVFGALHSSYADQKLSIDVRVDRLERQMSSQKQLDLLYRVKQLQTENQQLRSLLEEQNNEVHQLKQQQRELYSDLNRRMGQLEGKDDFSNYNRSNYNRSNEERAVAGTVPASSTKKQTVEVIDRSIVSGSPAALSSDSASQANIMSTDKKNVQVATIKPMSDKERRAEQKAYQKAFDELTARRYNKARDSFMQFLQLYPHGRYAHIAQYWVAESSYAQHHYEQSIIDYQLLLDVYPFSPKKAEAELKKAYCYNELGDKKKARQTIDSLLRNYPDTTEAGQAKHLLKKL